MPTSMEDAMNPAVAVALAGRNVNLQQQTAAAPSVPQVPRGTER
jgi:hypothetical protein